MNFRSRKAIQVLGQFERGPLRAKKWIHYHFREWLWLHGIAIRSNSEVEIRPLGAYDLDNSVTGWHQDGTGNHGKGARFWIVMWSDTKPSRFRLLKNKKELSVQPNDVVLIRNDLVEHRAPAASMRQRWFIRISDVGLLEK